MGPGIGHFYNLLALRSALVVSKGAQQTEKEIKQDERNSIVKITVIPTRLSLLSMIESH